MMTVRTTCRGQSKVGGHTPAAEGVQDRVSAENEAETEVADISNFSSWRVMKTSGCWISRLITRPLITRVTPLHVVSPFS